MTQNELIEVPVLSGQGGTQAGQGAPGTADGAAAPVGPGFDLLPILMIAAIFLIFMTLMGGRKEKKRRQELAKVGKHDRIRTRGGIIGSVVDSKEDVIVIKVDESRDTRITLDRQYIDTVLESSTKSED
ncbi:MAG: preprotein translocase subunit YajC [Planctomycetota bacterium]|nr:preprotein translocase subunit YajC [Planctomycetota bacterium]MEC9158490.1 preprotein translocase subunit YajC [Planctomycetota bacterium]MEC9233733.1 preprotein translocase subunit YajC [Planctomycetota bacterium]MED5507797.1 preprotein translocase subunit YajC [Planctomycetota bacterium]